MPHFQSEEEFERFKRERGLTEVEEEGQKKTHLTIILPFPLPTWNRVLAMHPMERKKLRDWLHHAVSISTQSGNGSQMQTECVENMSLMGLSMPEYYQMIRPSTSRKSRTRKRKGQKK
jgi:hypothetical protein